MDIDLSGLYNRTLNEIDITNTYNIPKEYYETTDVIKMEPIAYILIQGIKLPPR